jgi:hypothetical protein
MTKNKNKLGLRSPRKASPMFSDWEADTNARERHLIGNVITNLV